MDFDDTPEEAAFRAEAHAWLRAHAKLKDPAVVAPVRTGTGDREAELEHVAESKAWQAALYDGGWAGITWPKEFGGQGAGPVEAMIFAQEQSRFDVPSTVFAQGIGMAGPTLMMHGTEEQQDRYLRPMLRGDEIWCQLFSEPGAGSDLAGLATRAVRDGDEYVVNGQKVWTSSAHYSDWGILLARTDFDAPKHKGITYFLVDMRSPGIEVRPLRQATGAAHFNEVFLTDVRIPASQVIGEPHNGWRVAQTTLANERTLIGGGQGGSGFDDIAALARQTGGAGDVRLRQELAAAYTRYQLVRFLGYRIQTALSRGESPGPESSVVKLLVSQHQSRTADLIAALQGTAATLGGADAPANGYWHSVFLNQWASRIGGGTDQIQRNIIGERVLGLPREPSVDRDVPFSQLVKGG